MCGSTRTTTCGSLVQFRMPHCIGDNNQVKKRHNWLNLLFPEGNRFFGSGTRKHSSRSVGWLVGNTHQLKDPTGWETRCVFWPPICTNDSPWLAHRRVDMIYRCGKIDARTFKVTLCAKYGVDTVLATKPPQARRKEHEKE